LLNRPRLQKVNQSENRMPAELPNIKRVEGRIKNVTLDTFTPFASTSFMEVATYTFEIAGEKMAFLTGHWQWNPEPFLAEGDRVVVAVLDEAPVPGDAKRVYALQNVEDDCVYVAHYRWQGVDSRIAATRIPPKSEHRYVVAFTAVLLALFLSFAVAQRQDPSMVAFFACAGAGKPASRRVVNGSSLQSMGSWVSARRSHQAVWFSRCNPNVLPGARSIVS
jgi:hypothetical protein